MQTDLTKTITVEPVGGGPRPSPSNASTSLATCLDIGSYSPVGKAAEAGPWQELLGKNNGTRMGPSGAQARARYQI